MTVAIGLTASDRVRNATTAGSAVIRSDMA
jgi:hypothetical protein